MSPLTSAPAVLNPRLIDHFKRRFNCDFVFQHRTDTPDGQGGTTTDWTVAPLEVLGSLYTLTGAEKLAQGALVTTTIVKIMVAYIAGIDPTMRVLLMAVSNVPLAKPRTFDINDVTDLGEQRLLLEVMAIERFRK